MESVDAKMDRAKEHLDTLYAEAGIFFESTKRHFILKTDGHAVWIVHYIEDSIPPRAPGRVHLQHTIGTRQPRLRSYKSEGFARAVQGHAVPDHFDRGTVGKALAKIPEGGRTGGAETY